MIGSERMHFVNALAPDADALAGTKTTDYLNMSLYEAITFLLHKGVGATGTSTLTVLAASDNAGTGATAIAFKYRVVADFVADDVPGDLTDAAAAGFTTTAASNQLIEIEVEAAAMLEGKPWIALKSVEVANDPVDAGITAVMHRPRYIDNDPQSAI